MWPNLLPFQISYAGQVVCIKVLLQRASQKFTVNQKIKREMRSYSKYKRKGREVERRVREGFDKTKSYEE